MIKKKEGKTNDVISHNENKLQQHHARTFNCKSMLRILNHFTEIKLTKKDWIKVCQKLMRLILVTIDHSMTRCKLDWKLMFRFQSENVWVPRLNDVVARRKECTNKLQFDTLCTCNYGFTFIIVINDDSKWRCRHGEFVISTKLSIDVWWIYMFYMMHWWCLLMKGSMSTSVVNQGVQLARTGNRYWLVDSSLNIFEQVLTKKKNIKEVDWWVE